ncbi:MAG: nucleotidyltransferase [Lachnospiraceae bacterium]|jgi:predicted nucleotidyltransferase
MKIAGLIAEYNPFHKGHLYHMEKAKEITGADCCIAVMSGNYVQRGAPAVFDKYLRARMALSCGLDMILELPVHFACGSAEYFASGAVSLLNQLGCIDYLCFGSESGSLQLFGEISALLAEESSFYRDALQNGLRRGLSFPAARKLAIFDCAQKKEISSADNELEEFLSSPNNILGLEYCKAIIRQKASILPVTITRKGCGYHSPKTGDSFSSASAIRSLLEKGDSISDANPSMPLSAYDLMVNHLYLNGPVTADDFSLLLKYKLMEEQQGSLMEYWDMTEELASRIYRHLNSFTSYTGFVRLLKTKDLTYTRISRALLHTVLGIQKDTLPDRAKYARILGFGKNTTALKAIKNHTAIPIITKAADAPRLLDPEALPLWEQDIHAANLYETVAAHKFQRKFVHEYQQGLILPSAVP